MPWALLALFAMLPLQWFVLPLPGPAGQRLHIAAMLAVTLLVYLRLRPRAFRTVVSVSWPFLVSMGFLAGLWFVTALYHGNSPRNAVEAAVQLLVFIALGTAVYRSARLTDHSGLAVLRWAALACNAALVGALAVSMSVNGVDPLRVFVDTVASGDPNVLQRELFRSAFVGFGLEDESVKSQLRHEVFGAVLVSLYVALTARLLHPFRSRAAAWLFRLSVLVSVLLLLVSLSRSLLLAMLVWPALVLWRQLRSGKVSPQFVGGAMTAVAVGLLLGITGFLQVLWSRFVEDTSSYQSRDALLRQSWENIQDHWLVGGVETIGESSHNFVLDTWLRTGVFGAAAAALVFVLLVGLLLGFVGRLHVEPEWMVPVLALVALVVVRMLTAGGGAIPPVMWTSLAAAAGFLAFRRHAGAVTRDRELASAAGSP